MLAIVSTVLAKIGDLTFPEGCAIMEGSKGEGMEPTYMIIRFRFNGDNEVVRRGLTLEEAQAHCRDEDTHGEGWFDGYEEE